MERERWIQVRNLLHDLLEQDSTERKRLLDLVGATDPALRREAESLLKFENENALDKTAIGAGGLSREFEQAFPEQIGPYRLLHEIGRGGMGVVYEAERADGQFLKRVALKLLPAVYSQTELETRFLRERQILARLEHPNIARLLDGGVTPDGRPYLVMEFVEGVPLTDWVNQRSPTVRERLRLFLFICAAVSSAHRSLVVHRDLKPGNILVNKEGQAKLLDFGLARMLEPSGEVTQTMAQPGAPILTPAYASPEQVLNHPITVASDIFSLGVVLYELLTGKRPFGGPGDTAGQVQRAVCEVEPPAPSAAAPRLSADLDNIVLKAIEKQPAQRYISVDAFAADIVRYLDGRPVEARNAGIVYRAAKFLRRNRILTAVVTAAIMGILLGLAVAVREARLAEQRFNDVRRLAHSVLFDLHDTIAPLPGSTKARALLVSQGLEYLDTLNNQSRNDLDLKREVADGYVRLGSIQGQPGVANLGDGAGAIKSYEKAVALFEQVVHSDSQDRRSLLRLCAAYRDLASLEGSFGQKGLEDKLLEQARKLGDADSAAHPDDERARDNAAANNYALASLRIGAKRYDESIALLKAALKNYERDLAGHPDALIAIQNVAVCHKRIGAVLAVQKKDSEALEEYSTALKMDQQVLQRNPSDLDAQLNLTFTLSDRSLMLWRLGKRQEALEGFKKTLDTREEVVKRDPVNARAVSALASIHKRYGDVLVDTGGRSQALEHFQEAVSLYRGLTLREPEYTASLASAEGSMGDLLASEHRSAEAVPYWKSAIDLYHALEQRSTLTPIDRINLEDLEKKIQR
jgi:non-specific serine/threonine protein kinase/serine/threonine-protein kinase